MTRTRWSVIALFLIVAQAEAASTTHIWVPFGGLPASTSATNYSATNDEMRCWDWVEPTGITNADTIAWRVTTAGTAACSVTIYAAGGASIVRSSGVKDCSTANSDVVATGLTAFSLTAGTEYRLCVCDGGNDGAWVGGAWSTASFGPLIRASGVSLKQGRAVSNPCASAVAPSSTGTLTSETQPPNPPVVLIENAP